MAETDRHELAEKIASAFEELASEIERSIEALAGDESDRSDIEILQRARDAAARGAEAARKAMSED